MKYFFQALLLGYFVAALADCRNVPTKPVAKASLCNVNTYNSFFAGPNCKKIENILSEVKQQLAEIKQVIGEMKENQTGGPGEKEGTKWNGMMIVTFNLQFTRTVPKFTSPVTRSVDLDGLGEFKVFCDQKTAGGGWTVFQKRRGGSVDFFRAWDDYKRGFGNLNGEFWLGLDKIHRLTVSSSNKLRVDLEDIHGKTAFAEYSSFSVTSERAKFQLSLGSYSGTAGDSLSYHRGAQFSTKDRDNDEASGSCSLARKGAWWYKACAHSNLNGLYLNGKNDVKGMWWQHWKNSNESAKKSEMKIRPKNF
ncbi:hypothetical protein ACROYT_G003984 [Oculina patagonica]